MTKLTRVIVKYDAEWGNILFIRDSGIDGLNWDKDTPKQNIDCDEWLWKKVVQNGDIEFKILVNDEIRCRGEDFIVYSKESKTIRSVF